VVRTALNTRISWWRRRRREVGLDDQDHDHASPASQDGTYQRGLDTDLVAALRRLPVRQREVVALRLLLDLDTASTAEALGLATWELVPASAPVGCTSTPPKLPV
jgi:DNA-directed RNA polymerase specialized sigma24 family protein